jgi:methyl-accepting chemotaxis protein
VPPRGPPSFTCGRLRQSAKATSEIGTKIAEIQLATGVTADSISRIVKTIDTIQHASEAIAGAVE